MRPSQSISRTSLRFETPRSPSVRSMVIEYRTVSACVWCGCDSYVCRRSLGELLRAIGQAESQSDVIQLGAPGERSEQRGLAGIGMPKMRIRRTSAAAEPESEATRSLAMRPLNWECDRAW